jgi:DNA-binding NtrC family response regulator
MSNTGHLDGKKILIVDDEPDILGVLEDILEMCTVVKAATFEEGKAQLESRVFDVAILDIMGVDGYGLLEIATRRNIPAVMLTAHAFSPENLVKTIKEGAASYVPKEEISHITEYLLDVLQAKEEGQNPWDSWQERLPSSYFEKRWGAAWKDTDKDFWATFKAGLKSKKSGSKKA